MLFSYGYGQQQIGNNWQQHKIQVNRWQFRLPYGCGGTTRAASPVRARPWLRLEPMDAAAAIGRVPAPYHPGGCHGQRIH
jgi:hypothetical protein